MKIDLPNSNIMYFSSVFSGSESNKYYQYLEKLPYWEKRPIIVAGRKCQQNRLTCFFAEDTNLNYFYSGIDNNGHQFTPEIISIKEKVEYLLGYKYKFNYCLLNYYQDGNQNIGMHSDDETDLVEPVIASISFGAERFFDFQHKFKKTIPKKRLTLENGSLLVMAGSTQKYYKHGVPIQKNSRRKN